MIVREKFTPREWRKAFAKHSQLGYPSDDDKVDDEEAFFAEPSADFVDTK